MKKIGEGRGVGQGGILASQIKGLTTGWIFFYVLFLEKPFPSVQLLRCGLTSALVNFLGRL